MSQVFSKPVLFQDIIVSVDKDSIINSMMNDRSEEVLGYLQHLQLLSESKDLDLGEVPVAFYDENQSIRISLSHLISESEEKAFITVLNNAKDAIEVKELALDTNQKMEASIFIQGLDFKANVEKSSREIFSDITSMKLSPNGNNAIKVPTAVFLPHGLAFDLLTDQTAITPEGFLNIILQHVEMTILEMNSATNKLLTFAIFGILRGPDDTNGSVTLSDPIGLEGDFVTSLLEQTTELYSADNNSKPDNHYQCPDSESDESGESEESDIEVPNGVMKRVRQACSDTGTIISESGAIRAVSKRKKKLVKATSEQKAAKNKKKRTKRAKNKAEEEKSSTESNNFFSPDQDDFLRPRIKALRNGPSRKWSKPNAFGENVAFTWDDLVKECKTSGLFPDKTTQQIYDRIERSPIWIDEDTTPSWSKPELEYIRRIVSDMIDCEWKDKSGTLLQMRDWARLHEEDHELRNKDVNQIYSKLTKVRKEIEASQNVATDATIDTTSDSTSNTNDIVPEVASVDASNASVLNTERVTIPEWHPDQNEYLADRIRFLQNNGSTSAWRQPDANGEMQLYTADELAVEIFNNDLFGDKTLKQIKSRISKNCRWMGIRFRKEWHPEATEHIRHIVRELNERNWKDENEVTLTYEDVVAEHRTDTGILRDKDDSMIKNKLINVKRELKRENTVA